MGRIHIEMAQAGNEMVKVGPDQGQRDQLPDKTRQAQHADVEGGLEFVEGDLGRDRGVEHPDDEGHQHKHDDAAGPVQDGDPGCRRHAVGGQVLEGVDVAELRPLGTLFGGQLCHCLAFVEEIW
eukprot:Amastigsp_a529669_9.p2 type:complete len:124 gc:universal Amastigsp_a529669_9:127-498(+)